MALGRVWTTPSLACTIASPQKVGLPKPWKFSSSTWSAVELWNGQKGFSKHTHTHTVFDLLDLFWSARVCVWEHPPGVNARIPIQC